MTSVHEKNGVRTSRIRPFITEGSSVTVTRQDADYFVTEFGVAQVKGKNLKDRARCLIEIAHPDFRPELIAEYERRFKVAYSMAAYSGASKKKEPHSYKRIQAELKEDRLKNILLLFGREKYLIRWACEQIRKRYVMSAAELFDFVKIDGSSEDTGRISEACETLPMLSEKRVVLVSDFDESSGEAMKWRNI